jgi:hypothetical protein
MICTIPQWDLAPVIAPRPMAKSATSIGEADDQLGSDTIAHGNQLLPAAPVVKPTTVDGPLHSWTCGALSRLS